MTPRSVRPLLVAMVLAIFAVLALVSPEAAAAERDMVLQVELTGSDRAPTHVCVVTTTPGQVEQHPSLKIGTLNNLCDAHGCRYVTARTLAEDEVYLGHRQEAIEEDERTKKAWSTLEGLIEEKNEHQCDYGGTGCKPFFSLRGFEHPNEANITCVRNSTNRTHGPSRALVVSLTAQHKGTHGPYLRDIRLEGQQLLLTLKKVDELGHLVRILGGFYAPIGEVHFSPGVSERSLKVEARCQWTTVGIPSIAARKDAKPDDLEIQLKTEGDYSSSSSTKDGGCWSGSFQDQSIRLLLPYDPNGRKVLTINPPDEKWKLRANWYGARSAVEQSPTDQHTQLDMGVTKLSFSWRSDPCLYPEGKCPTATISTSDITCKADPEYVKDGQCTYSCPAKEEEAGHGQLDFPTSIAFSLSDSDVTPASRTTDATAASSNTSEHHGVYQNWTIDINTVDQTLEGFVDPSERSFPIRFETRNPFPRRKNRDRAQDQDQDQDRDQDPTLAELQEVFCNDRNIRYDDIHAVDLTTPDGLTRRLELNGILGCADEGERKRKRKRKNEPEPKPKIDPAKEVPSVVVKLPNVSCREPIGYRYIGERDYDERLAKVEDGEILLEHPMASARILHLAVGLYPASVRTVLPSDLRSESLIWAPMLEASAVLKPPHDRLRGWRFSLDGTMLGTRQPFLGIAEEPGQYDLVPEHRNYIRLLVGGSVLTPWIRTPKRAHENPVGRAFALGAGLQLGGGAPLRKKDFELLNNVEFAFGPRVDIRFRLSRHFEASFSPRYIYGANRVRYSTNFSGQPKKDESKKMHTFVLPAGLVFIW